MPGTAYLLITLIAVAPVVAPLEAQVVRGRLLESGSRQPIVLGRVMLLDTAYASIVETITDQEGRYNLQAPRPGDYWIAADRLGYKPVIDGIVELGEGGLLPADLYMRPDPVTLEEIEVTAERRRMERVLTNAGFYDRRKHGFGHFVGPEEIERGNAVDVSDLFRGVLAVRSAGDGFVCNGRLPRVFVDGSSIAFPSLGGDQVAAIGRVVDVADIAGIEVYTRPSTIPLQWGGTIASATSSDPGTRAHPVCTILIWTRG